jgi:hypothetical protein
MATQQVIEEWQTFYNERAQREYYYNDKTKIVTWILPDNDHPDGKASEHEIVERKERGVVSLNNGVERGISNKKRRRIRLLFSANTWTFILLAVSAIVTLAVWSMQERGGSHTSTEHVPVEFAPVHIEALAVAAEILEIPREDEAMKPVSPEQGLSQATSISPELEGSEVKKDKLELSEAEIMEQERIEALKSRRRVFGVAHGRMSGANIPEEPPTAEHETVNPLLEKDTAATEPTKETAATAQTPLVKVEIPTIEQLLVDDEATESDKKRHLRCFVPLMHVFSKKCRKIKTPLFDSEQFVDNMMQ